MNALLKERLQEIIRICALIIEEDHALEIERERSVDRKIIPFNPLLWDIHCDDEKPIIQAETACITFTEKEINTMPKLLRNQIRAGRFIARARKHLGGYEVRLVIYGNYISGFGKTVEIAKQRFLRKMKEVFPNGQITKNTPQRFIKEYIMLFMETMKKPYVKDNTYKSYLQIVNAYIIPHFGTRNVATVKQLEVQQYINSFTLSGRHRTARSVYQLLAGMFDCAVADGLIDRSPTLKIRLGHYEETHGDALTREEERQLIERLKADPGDIYCQAYIFFLYTGLRRSELASVDLSGKWISVVCAKTRKGYSEKRRRIPVSPMLEKVLPMIDVAAIRAIPTSTLSNRFIRFSGRRHHLHELRHTFVTRCQECGVPREVVSLWAGHAPDKSITTRVYTHLESCIDLQLEEIKKVSYEL